MNTTFEAMAAKLSAPEGWTYSDGPYGIEPLILPPAAAPGEEIERLRLDTEPGPGATAFCPTLLAHGQAPQPLDAPAARQAAHPRVYWFRWITGHQISFVLWRLILQEMRTAALTDGGRQARAVAAMTAYVRGYCSMLLYTASCPRDIYESLIRPSMFLAHPGFSGTWAPDFAAVRQVFRGRRPEWSGSTDEAVTLRRTVELYRHIHAGVAAKLVPAGGSLLQEAPSYGTLSPELLGTLFDTYFLTARSPECADRAVPQLLRRLEAVTLDLAEHGLTAPGDEAERPAELRGEEVLDIEGDLIGIILRVAELAAGMDPSDLDLRPQFV
ncbi:hypothetical protein ACWC10_26965 [Streptomyces sp. NPDC001595]|uniref:hypothetical protein n=1 Tax=Streptomyces sp. NPDC001532 TaxID=3154520 RepID=UPI0033327E17